MKITEELKELKAWREQGLKWDRACRAWIESSIKGLGVLGFMGLVVLMHQADQVPSGAMFWVTGMTTSFIMGAVFLQSWIGTDWDPTQFLVDRKLVSAFKKVTGKNWEDERLKVTPLNDQESLDLLSYVQEQGWDQEDWFQECVTQRAMLGYWTKYHQKRLQGVCWGKQQEASQKVCLSVKALEAGLSPQQELTAVTSSPKKL